MKAIRPKFETSLTFRGFAMAPDEVEALVGFPATSKGARGTTRDTGTPLRRSFVRWAIDFADSARLAEMIPALVSTLGGVEHLASARKRVLPEFVEVNVAMWIKDSDEQEGGSIDIATIATLAKLSATLSFGFYTRSAVEPVVPADTLCVPLN